MDIRISDLRTFRNRPRKPTFSYGNATHVAKLGPRNPFGGYFYADHCFMDLKGSSPMLQTQQGRSESSVHSFINPVVGPDCI